MSSVASSSPRAEPVGLNRQEVGSVLGMSAVFILTADREAKYHFISDSVLDILGYQPDELIGTSPYQYFHPDEIPMLLDIHRRVLVDEGTAAVTYMQFKHKSGIWMNCAVEYSTVFDRSVGTITRAENGPLTIKQRLTAREVNEITPRGDGKYTVRKWSTRSRALSRTPSPVPEYEIDTSLPWPKPVAPAKRTAFLIDRFTDTSRVMYETNNIIVNPRGLRGQPFYSIVKPSDRAMVRRHIDAVKNWSPIVRTERRSGGVGYAEFHVLKIPDLPQEGETYPQGTDESERHMPGQEFILVEGIFTGCSDALVCIINRIDRRKGKRDRRDESMSRFNPTTQRRGSDSTVASTATTASEADVALAGASSHVTPSTPPLIQRIARMRQRGRSGEPRDSDGEEEEVVSSSPQRGVRAKDFARETSEPKRQKSPDKTAEQLERMHVSYQRSPLQREAEAATGSNIETREDSPERRVPGRNGHSKGGK